MKNQTNNWTDICHISDIPAGSGVCAWHQGKQVAIFNLESCNDGVTTVKSICNVDPVADASVLSRGLLADVDGRLVVASPLNKKHYCLETGQCLQNSEYQVNVYPVRVVDSTVQLQSISG
jgi:NAD(P)H-dependent nitrite reductase small subunit